MVRISDRFDAGRAVVAPFLRSRGVNSIDMLVVSHRDNDHLGGAASLRREIRVGSVITSVPGRLARALGCRAGETWEWDQVRFSVVFPFGPGAGDNNDGCVLLVTSAHGRILLPADIEAPVERELLLRMGAGLRAEVLVAPHHGSKTSSTTDFIAAVRPALVLFPVGYRNRYRHPHVRVVERYAEAGARRLDSARDGAVRVALEARGIAVESYRETHARYWFSR